MKIAVLGAGNIGCAVAADLTRKGHVVTLIKTSTSMHNEDFEYLIQNNGYIEVWQSSETFSVNIAHLTKDLSLISEAELIYITITTDYHESLIKKMKPYLKDGQIVILTPGYLSTAYLLKHCSDIKLTIVEGESTTIDCRLSKPGHIRIGSRNVRNYIGVYPKGDINQVKDKLDTLQYNYVYMSSVVEAALHNPNLIVHTVGAIMSMPRIEKTQGDYCMYWEVFTPSVWNILERLDGEKMAVLKELGFDPLPYVEKCKRRNSTDLDSDQDGKEIFFEYALSPTRAKGPVVVDARYISEDVPEGLVMLEALGKQLDVRTPVCTALIEMASAALGRDLRMAGRSLERLGTENIKKIIEDGR